VRTVYFSSSARVVAGLHVGVRDRAGLERFAAKAAPGDGAARAAMVRAGRGADFSRSVLVGWTATTGCSAATAAALDVVGDRLAVRVRQPRQPPECFAVSRVAVVFEVPKERMPERPVFG
jgi:hypothetical protein